MSETKVIIKVNGADVHYWTYGDKTKPTLLMIHGFTGSHEGFQYLTPRLANKFFMIIPDLPGFGISPLNTTDFTIDALAANVNDFVKSLKLKNKPYVVSHSMGGLVAASMLAQAPQLYGAKTVFISPVAERVKLLDARKPGVIIGSAQYLVGVRAGKFGEKIVGSERLSGLATSVIATTKDTELRKSIHAHHIKNLQYISSIDYYYQLHKNINTLGAIDYAPRLQDFNISVVSGDNDNVTPLAGQKRLAEAIGADLTIIPGVGHLAHYEKPDAIVDVILTSFEQ